MCRPGWRPTQRLACLCVLSARIQGVPPPCLAFPVLDVTVHLCVFADCVSITPCLLCCLSTFQLERDCSREQIFSSEPVLPFHFSLEAIFFFNPQKYLNVFTLIFHGSLSSHPLLACVYVHGDFFHFTNSSYILNLSMIFILPIYFPFLKLRFLFTNLAGHFYH